MTSTTTATDLVISSARQEIVFIMDDVGNHAQLAASLGAGREVVILDAAGDGLAQIAQALEGRSGIDALHVISHGSAGGVALGSLVLGSAEVLERQPELAAIGRSLAPDADVLLYGCDAGAGGGLADALAIATGADVAMSDDLTGHTALGADWDLEVSSGNIETVAVVDAQVAAGWQEVLAIPGPTTITFDSFARFSNPGQAYDPTQNSVYNVNGNSSYQLVIDGAQLGTATYNGYGRVYLGSRNGSEVESAVSLSFADGQSFTANSLQFFNWAGGMPVGTTTQTFVVSGYASDGSLVGSPQTLTLAPTSSLTLTFAGLTDITTLKITSSTNGGNLIYFSIDNLSVSNVLPAAPGVVSLSSSTVNGTYKVGDTIQVSVGFDQTVVVTGTPQLTLETGSTDRVVNYASGSGSSTLTFSYTVQAGDTSLDLDAFSSAALSLNGGTIRSAGGADADLVLPTPGTAGSLSANESIVIDGVAPTAAITASDTTLKAGETATVTFTFSEDPGASFTLADLTVAGGTLGALSGTGLVRTATFTPTAGTNGGTASITLGSGGYTDAAGNGGATASINLSFDTLAPAASAPDLKPLSDSGSSLTDNITSVGTPTFTGTTEAGATVSLFDTDGTTLLGTTTADGSGNWSITSSNLAEGAHTVTVRAVDAAGNTSSASSGLAVTIDTTAPTVAITSDRATLATGQTATITFTFSENPGASFTSGDLAVSGGTLSALVGSGTTRTATFTPTANTDDGVASITITANSWADVAGNLGGAGTRPTLTFDTRAPDAPAAPVLEAGSDSGASSSDGITSDTTPTFSGTAEAGATVRLYDTDGTTVLGSTTADGSGNWSITSSSLAEGAHTVTVRAVDAAGNNSSASSGLAVRIDTTAPTVAITSDRAALAAGETATITFTFSENPGASFTLGDVVVSGGTLGALSGSGATRTATFTPTASTDDGVASITISAGSWQDAAGNTGGAGTRPALTFDTRAPDAPPAPELQAGSDTGASSSDGITSDTTPTFSGTAEAGATVRLYGTDGTTVLGTTTAASNGNWSITTTALAEGTHALTVRAEDAAGNLGAASEALTVVVDTTAPVAGSTPDLADASDTGTSSDDNVTADATPTFTGTAEAGALVTLYDANGNVLGQGIATDGTWSITSATLAEGSHLLHTRVTDTAGNSGPASRPLPVLVDLSAPVASVTAATLSDDTGRSGSDFVTSAAAQVISGTLSTPLEAREFVQVSLDNGATWNLATAAAGDATWSYGATLTGSGTLLVRVTDAIGRSGVAWSQDYVLDTAIGAPSTPVIAAGGDSGISPTDGLIRDRTPTLTGTAEAGAVVTLFDTDGTTAVGTATANGNGDWSITTAALTDGMHQLTATATDAAGNTSVASTALGIVVDKDAPTVRIVASPQAAGTYEPGDVIVISVRFSEAVLVEGEPSLALETGSVDRMATFAGGSGTQMLTFSYTVQAGDATNDLDYLGAGALHLNGGSIRDAAGNAATLALPDPGAPGSLAGSEDLAIDGVAPSLVAARVDGKVLVLRYDEVLDAGNLAGKSAFTVHAGGQEVGIDSVLYHAANNIVVLRLDEAVAEGETVSVDYRDEARDQVRAIQDLVGNDAAALDAVTVRNLTLGGSADAHVQVIGVAAEAPAGGAWF